MKIATPRTLSCFPTSIEMLILNLTSNAIILRHFYIVTIDKLSIIRDYVDNDDQFTKKTAISQD